MFSSHSFQMVTRTKKIFVGGLSANTVVEDVKQYFEQFGKVRAYFCALLLQCVSKTSGCNGLWDMFSYNCLSQFTATAFVYWSHDQGPLS